MNTCSNCNQEFSTPLKKCARCKTMYYCSRECQVQNWKTHKPNCIEADQSTELRIVRKIDFLKNQEEIAEGETWKLVPIAGKGLGLISKKFIKKGELILSDVPIFSLKEHEVPKIEEYFGTENNQKGTQPEFVTKIVWTFPSYSKNHKKTAMDIIAKNSFPMGNKRAMFPICCRLNHSCRNNANQNWNEKFQCEDLYAIRDIQPGEEITIKFKGNPYAQKRERQESIKQHFNFSCTCEACSLESEELEKSENRLKRLSTLSKAVYSFVSRSQGRKALQLIEEMLQLIDEEGLSELERCTCYYDAFQACLTMKDMEQAKTWAKMSYESSCMYQTSSDPKSQKYLRYSVKPEKHPGSGANSCPTQ